MSKIPMRRVRGVVFDMDGTLSLPQNYMFGEMRQALEIPPSEDILDFVHALPEERQKRAHLILKDIEQRTMLKMRPQPGLRDLFSWLRDHKLPFTIQTRNTRGPVDHFLETWLPGFRLTDPVLTREFYPYKPAPDGLVRISKAWNLEPSDLIMVGDSADDILAATNAGALSVLLRNSQNAHLVSSKHPDVVIDSLLELIPLLESRLDPDAS